VLSTIPDDAKVLGCACMAKLGMSFLEIPVNVAQEFMTKGLPVATAKRTSMRGLNLIE
jgi:hypothetical protein